MTTETTVEQEPAVEPVGAVTYEQLIAMLVDREEGRRPLRASLLAWLSSVVDSVSDAMERKFFDLAGYSPMEYPSSTFRKIREIRQQIFSGA